MKICFFAPGDSVHSLRWIDYFAQRGHEVHWVSIEAFTVKCSHPILTHVLAPVKNELHQVIRATYELRSLLGKIKPDILHVHSAGRNGVVSVLTGFHPRVITAWGSEVLIAGKSMFLRPLVRSALSGADLITCDAEHMRRAMVEMGVDEKKISIIYFGTDTEKFSPKPRSGVLRSELGLVDDPTIISLRSLEPLYNVETLLTAARKVLDQVPHAFFIIVGDGSERKKLTQLARSLGIQDRVRFTGRINNQHLPDYLCASDIYVSTSLSDAGLAASTAEAMACGLPVVVTNSGENALWIEENRGGYIVDVKDPNALAERLKRLLDNPGLRAKFGSFNRSIIEKRNNYRVEMSSMEKIYERMVNND